MLIPCVTPIVQIINSIRCEVCKIDCNSRDVLEKHMLGKKHKRNVQMQQMVPPDIFPSPLDPNESLGQTISGASGMIVGEELEAKKRKMLEGGASADSMMFCTICNVACNSQAVFIMHLSGRKHAAQVNYYNLGFQFSPIFMHAFTLFVFLLYLTVNSYI